MPLPLRVAAALVLLVGFGPSASQAQDTNQAIYQNLALRCLSDVPDTLQAFRLLAPSRMPYVRTALTQHWRRQGYRLFLADTAQAPAPLPLLRYAVEEANVAYQRADGRRLHRQVELALRYTLTAADGALLRDAGCRETYEDTFRRSALTAVETTGFPETRADPPPAGWWRRYLEPAILTAATGITIYLFFSLRSLREE